MIEMASPKHLKVLMLFSLIFGGFLALLYLAQLYSIFWRHEFLSFMPGRGGGYFEEPRQIITSSPEALNGTFRPFTRPSIALDPLSLILSPFNLLHLLTAVAFLANGYYLWRFLNAHNRAEAKDEVYAFVLSDEEKQAVAKLREAGGKLTQKDLSVKTGFSAVKTHRIVNRLKGKGAVETHAFGMTNMVVLK
jgi:hypothetical protein